MFPTRRRTRQTKLDVVDFLGMHLPWTLIKLCQDYSTMIACRNCQTSIPRKMEMSRCVACEAWRMRRVHMRLATVRTGPFRVDFDHAIRFADEADAEIHTHLGSIEFLGTCQLWEFAYGSGTLVLDAKNQQTRATLMPTKQDDTAASTAEWDECIDWWEMEQEGQDREDEERDRDDLPELERELEREIERELDTQ